jgi:MFS family permease
MVWLIVVGLVLLIVAAVIEAYCEFGRQAAPKYRPEIFNTRTGLLFWIGWIVLLLVGGMLLLIADWRWALGAIFVFWLLLPLWLVPAMRRRLLPPWEIVKEELEGQGYTEKNYTTGDWWKKTKEPKKTPKKEPEKKLEKEP